jgi:4-hydroxy-3-polyprenylbenzoate decarboxylase
MSYPGLRDFIGLINEKKELERINGVDWNLEMGAIVEIIYREGKAPKPAIIFDQIKGYPEGFRTMYGMLGSPWRLAKTLGLPEDTGSLMQLHQAWYQRHGEIKPVKPKVVKTGPVMENTDTGEKINVLKFPVPQCHDKDGGRYLGTAHAVITKDPDTGWINLGTYRVMVVDKDRLALHSTSGKHGNMMNQKYFSRGLNVPIAIAAGLEPALWWQSCQADTPWGTSEYDMAGGVMGEPIEVIEGPYSGLPIPAQAEIVIEGEIHPGEYADEGPFGEWHGYYGNRGLKSVREPVIRVNAVHYRNDPILTCSQPSMPPHTFSMMLAVADSVAIRARLEAYGIPGIKAVWTHFTGSGGLFNVISLEQMYSGHAVQAGMVAAQFSPEMGAYTVVVEEDIDPTNLEQVLWAMVTRAKLDKQIHIVPGCHTNNVNPTLSPAEKMNGEKQRMVTQARVVIDACRDLSWKEDWYPMARMEPGLRTDVFNKWQALLNKFVG